MATTKFYLDKRSKRKDGSSPLKLGITHKQTSALISTSVFLTPEQWDKDKDRVVNHPRKQSLNNYLTRFSLDVETELLNLQLERLGRLNASAIKKEIMKRINPEEEKETIGLFEQRFIEYIQSKSKKSTRELYESTFKKITNFVDDIHTLKFEDITVGWLKSFDKHLENSVTSINGRAIHFRNLRAVFNEAIDDDVITHYPFRKFKIKHERTAKRSLTIGELSKFKNYSVEPHQEQYQDLFMLLFYLIGINIIDLCYAKKTDVVNGRLEYKRSKTGRMYSIKILPETQKIIDKYSGETYLLNIMERYSNYKDFAHRFNKNLKEIGFVEVKKHGKKIREAAFPKLSTYWTRHTWATIAWSLDISKDTIAAALGHGGNTVTDIYINIDNKKIDEANEKVVDYVLKYCSENNKITT
ncbi:site-specific integrase [Bacteroidales bacterium OttesenSCG-928-M11]|nr:site-specific integrase [Bacteroidales bacterium OttesenSCG-928-M11]